MINADGAYSRPHLWVVAGPNGAGKTTLVRQTIAGWLPVINPDDIAIRLPHRQDGSVDEIAAGRQALLERQQMLDAGRSFAVETTMTGCNPLRFMGEAGRRGFHLTLVYVGIASAALSLQRVRDRVAAGGHNVPVDAIMRRYPDTMGKLATAMGMVDRAYVIDNSGTGRRLLIKIESKRTVHVAEHLPAWAERAVPVSFRDDG